MFPFPKKIDADLEKQVHNLKHPNSPDHHSNHNLPSSPDLRSNPSHPSSPDRPSNRNRLSSPPPARARPRSTISATARTSTAARAARAVRRASSRMITTRSVCEEADERRDPGRERLWGRYNWTEKNAWKGSALNCFSLACFRLWCGGHLPVPLPKLVSKRYCT